MNFLSIFRLKDFNLGKRKLYIKENVLEKECFKKKSLLFETVYFLVATRSDS